MREQEFAYTVRQIVDTAPVKTVPQSDVLVISQVRSTDVLMYLLAIKSLLAQLDHVSVLVVDDGLPSQDRELIASHVRGVTFRSVTAVDTGKCPQGGTWERLLTICDMSFDRYVIQLDSDVLTLGDITTVGDCIQNGRSFLLGTAMTPDFVSAEHAADCAKRFLKGAGDHVQIAAEAVLDEIGDQKQTSYIRGCSAFAGFAKGAVNRQSVEKFSVKLENRIGRKWHEWGSEQVASNFAISNLAEPLALPQSKYVNFGPNIRWREKSLIHFIGTYRFSGGVYSRLAKQQILKFPKGGRGASM